MVTKRKSPARARTKTRTVYRAAPRKRKANMGYDKIGPAMATVALVALNGKNVLDFAKQATSQGYNPGLVYERVTRERGTVNALRKIISAEALATDAVAVGGALLGGEIIRKYAPTSIKKPLAKIAKKIPKVF